jgi:hypothetical protein
MQIYSSTRHRGTFRIANSERTGNPTLRERHDWQSNKNHDLDRHSTSGVYDAWMNKDRYFIVNKMLSDLSNIPSHSEIGDHSLFYPLE